MPYFSLIFFYCWLCPKLLLCSSRSNLCTGCSSFDSLWSSMGLPWAAVYLGESHPWGCSPSGCLYPSTACAQVTVPSGVLYLQARVHSGVSLLQSRLHRSQSFEGVTPCGIDCLKSVLFALPLPCSFLTHLLAYLILLPPVYPLAHLPPCVSCPFQVPLTRKRVAVAPHMLT